MLMKQTFQARKQGFTENCNYEKVEKVGIDCL